MLEVSSASSPGVRRGVANIRSLCQSLRPRRLPLRRAFLIPLTEKESIKSRVVARRNRRLRQNVRAGRLIPRSSAEPRGTRRQLALPYQHALAGGRF